LIVLSLLVSLVFSQSTWVVEDKDYATIAIGLDFQADQTGWVLGGSGSDQPLVLYTTDGGRNFTNMGVANVSNAAFMSVRFAPDGKNGVAGALGFIGLICGAYTNDGQNWQQTHEGKDLVCVGQGAAVPDSNTMVLVGQWISLKDPQGDGVQISTDAGKTWIGQNWNMGTEARYAEFISADLGYVTGGQWPEDNSTDTFLLPKRLSKHLLYNGRNIQFHPDTKPYKHDVNSTNPNDYQGVIAKATSGASSWQVLVNLTNEGLYFNQISCVDENNCWAVCEGNNITNGAVAAWIYATTDGWQTYSVQYYFEGGSLITIQMISATYGWAAGAFIPSSTAAEFIGAFYVTTDGMTWTLEGSPKNFYAMDLSVIDMNYAYSAGLSPLGLSSLARYAPNQS
jgi:hypothetical protein